MKAKQVVTVILISASTAVATMWGYNRINGSKTYFYAQDSSKIPVNYAKFFEGERSGGAGPLDFTDAASAAIPATVHIKTKTVRTVSNNLPKHNPFSDLFGIDPDDFFGNGNGLRSLPEMASGSGVIISNDGYIVTNNHVVDGADEVTVTLSNRKSFKAKVIGADPSSDLAVIKIDAQGLPFLLYGNSDDVKIGQWVLAVGYPLNLETTVTAGIVSAKGRTLDINRRQSQTPLESFIQTDAAVNPGNSGGPLINPEGQLIGINSAIASPTGSYAGYSFTIPVNIVKKIVNDIMKFGTPQRAYLGIQYPRDDMSDDQKKEQGIKDGEGVYVMDVTADGAASHAGIQKGDMITKLNGTPVFTGAELVGQIATYSPGDKITVTYKRDGKENNVTIQLRNNSGTIAMVKTSVLDKLGAQLQTLSKKESTDLDVKGGVIVKSVTENGLMDKSRIQEGFIILKANGQEVRTKEELEGILSKASGTVKLEGVFSGYEGLYTYPLRLSSGE
ncbi:MAG: trypsin-like peptidase domain-containing protein [Bacteroidota bacterium]|nr:trypsin-like peptidase domain-containing protein [Bacteroidota bacterium]MDP4244663.1 trypsin-like peptidase domain-containing protein [Bacteroidota bacterium]MDP4253283.1 trypsin-like peptidase domain-containing protein [Bacteroidota bacterium]MDP4256904.1 trypsin-like peptidase domain-containing protein [Bacteroidota bacterium]